MGEKISFNLFVSKAGVNSVNRLSKNFVLVRKVFRCFVLGREFSNLSSLKINSLIRIIFF